MNKNMMFHEPISEKSGQIQVILGPMFSGKTTELIRRMKRYNCANYRCLVIRYANDNRYDAENVATHDRQTIKAVSAVELNTIESMVKDIDVIGIDEGQFFPDTVDFCERMANNQKIVIVSALDATFQRTSFGDILNLIPIAESVEKLTAVCMSCFKPASFTKRLGNEKEVEIIGGAEKYMAVCRECHKMEAPVRKSPFKIPDEENKVEKGEANGMKRKLFENTNTLPVPVPAKSIKQTEV